MTIAPPTSVPLMGGASCTQEGRLGRQVYIHTSYIPSFSPPPPLPQLAAWWDEVAYLGYRQPVLVHSSPAIGYPKQAADDRETYLR